MSIHHFAIAGYTFALDVDEACEPLRLKTSFTPFRCPPMPNPDARFRIGSETERPFPREAPAHLHIDCESWRFGQFPDGRYFMEISYQPRNYWQPAGHFASDFSEGVLYPKYFDAESPAPYTLFFPVDEQIFLHRMGMLGGALIHGCGVSCAGQALLFCGKSGIGKSTTGHLWREAGYTLLNDDRMVLRMAEGIPLAGATPWHGTEPSVVAANAPLAGIFHLAQARDNRLEPLSAKAGFLKLMANLIGPFHLQPAMQAIMDAVEEVTRKVPSYILHFRPDQDAVRVVRDQLGL